MSEMGYITEHVIGITILRYVPLEKGDYQGEANCSLPVVPSRKENRLIDLGTLQGRDPVAVVIILAVPFDDWDGNGSNSQVKGLED